MLETFPGKDPAKTAAIQPTPSTIFDGTDISQRVHGSDCALMVLFYLITIITALLFSGRYDTHSTDKIPWVGESNATLIVNNRLQTVESDIESALNSDNWKTLRTLTNMSIDILRTDSLDWPYYVRLTAVVQMKPSNLFRNYLADKLHYTLLRTDNFHVSLRSLFIPEPETQIPGNIIGIFRKISQPLIKVMTLRETSAAVIEKSLKHDMSINAFKIKYGGMIDGVATSTYKVTNVPEGSLVVASVTVNVVAKKPIVVKKATAVETSDSWIAPILSSIYASLRTCDELVDKLIELGTRYKKTTADGLIYFIPFQDDTLLIKVMRMDPGIAINEWTEDLLINHYGFSTLAAITRIAAEELDDLEDLDDFDNE